MSINYFELFEIETKYAIDITKLHDRYLLLQRMHHPDNLKNSTARQSALNKSIDINNAYNVLRDPLSRAEYLLSLYNIDINDNARKISIEQLDDIFNDFERIDDMDAQEINSEYRNKLKLKERMLQNLEEAFECNKIDKAIEITISAKYLCSIINTLRHRAKLYNLLLPNE